MNQLLLKGHLAATFAIFVWGITYISTKVLLVDFSPSAILLTRFVIGLVCLKLICPKGLGFNKNREIWYFLAGLSGIGLYFLLENIALTLTSASNVGVILAITPLFTAIVTKIFYKNESQLSIWFFIGLVTAVTGIAILSFHGSKMEVNPKGDLLAVLAGFVWAFYSVIIRKISNFGVATIPLTRRTFTYGFLIIVAISPFTDFRWNFSDILKPINFFNFAFLGCCASAACFAVWNIAVKALGPVASTVYLYAGPVITVLFAWLILDERLTVLGILGCVLAMVGLFISQDIIRNAIFAFLKKSLGIRK